MACARDKQTYTRFKSRLVEGQQGSRQVPTDHSLPRPCAAKWDPRDSESIELTYSPLEDLQTSGLQQPIDL